MTPGMQVRLWFRRASARQRWTTVAVIGVLVLALIASIAIRPGSKNNGHRVTSTAGGQTATGGSASTPGETTATGVPADATTGASAGSAPASGSGTRTSGAGTTGAPGTTGVGGNGGGGGTAGSVTRIASDRGVTANTLKIGFLPANVGGLDAAGYALNIRGDVPQYVQALADSVNKSGGVNGRKVEVTVRKTDPTSQSDQAAACSAMVNDAKVFGVVDVGALADTPAMECVAARNKTPYVHNTIWDSKWLARSGGMEVGYQAAIDRISKTWSRISRPWAGSGRTPSSASSATTVRQPPPSSTPCSSPTSPRSPA